MKLKLLSHITFILTIIILIVFSKPASTQSPSGAYGPQPSIYFGNLAKDNGSDYITGLLANGSTIQTARDVVGISNTSVWAPDTLNPTNPFMFGYDGLTGFGLGASNSAVTTSATAIGGYSDGIVALTTSGAGQTVSVTDMIGYVANVPIFGGPGTMSATRKSGFWANNQGNSHVATSYGFRADAQSGSTVNNWGFLSAATNNDQMGNLTVTSAKTSTDCAVNSVSPAACVAACSGAFVVPTTTTTYTVNTTCPTTNTSHIFLFPRTDATGLPSAPTCVAVAVTSSVARSAHVNNTSFTFILPSTTGTTCWDYWIISN